MAKRGFTMLELLIVISVMAIVATLATGAAVKSMRQGRRKRIEVTVQAVNSALESYHARTGFWPFDIKKVRRFAHAGDENVIVTNEKTKKWAEERQDELGRDRGDFYKYSLNPPIPCKIELDESVLSEMFANLYKEGFLNGSGLYGEVNGQMKLLNKIKRSAVPDNLLVCCPSPDDASQPFYFALGYNPVTDFARCMYWNLTSDEPSWVE